MLIIIHSLATKSLGAQLLFTPLGHPTLFETIVFKNDFYLFVLFSHNRVMSRSAGSLRVGRLLYMYLTDSLPHVPRVLECKMPYTSSRFLPYM